MAERINEIMILNDGETFTGLEGCVRAEVLYDQDIDGTLTEEQWDEKVEALEMANDDGTIWEDAEYGIIAKIVERY